MIRLSVMEAFRLGFVPPMAGAAGDGTAAAPGGDGGAVAAPENANGNGNGNGLYDEHLAETPEELRPYVTDAFKKWDSQVTPKLQEAAKLREQFGPLSEIDGLSDVPPDELAELVAFRQVLQNPEQLKDWLTQVNEAVGLNPGELSQEDWLSMGQQQGWLEDDGEPAALSPQDIAQQVLEMLKPELAPVKEFMGKTQQEQITERAKQEYASRMAALEEEHGKLPDDNARDAIYELASNWVETDKDPIGKAFERFLQITGRAEGERVDGQLRQPNGALNGGRPDTAPPKASWSGDGPNPKDIALARMKQS